MNKKFLFLLFAILICLTGCDTGIRQMGPTEFGVRFRRLPPSLGGGIGDSVIQNGTTAIIWPWDTIYRIDTQLKEVAWGQVWGGDQVADYVQTRALDGNEVALAVKIQYSISTDTEKLTRLVREVATSNDEVTRIVNTVGRADIRTYMNGLRTAEFFDNKRKFEAGEEVRRAMQSRLEPWGIIIHSVNLGEHRFERTLPDGTIDASYQEKINEVQTLEEQTKREELRKATVEADKAREFNIVQAEVNRQIEEARGYLSQSKLKGDGYSEAKGNEAKAILAKGIAEVDGLIEQINALSGPGGQAILKLELARFLVGANPKFVVMGGRDSKRDGIDVQKIDANELLNQIGLIEAMKDSPVTQPKEGEKVLEKKVVVPPQK